MKGSLNDCFLANAMFRRIVSIVTTPTVKNLVLISGLLIAGTHLSNAQTPGMVEFLDAGKVRQGLKLLDVPNEILILGRDGAMHSVDPRRGDAKVQSIVEPYTPVSVMELRGELHREFGKTFEVRATQNFLVVQPQGRGDQWPDLFEQSHRSFCRYMSARGVKIRKGRFPMVAVVMPDEPSMYREFNKMDIHIKRVAGVYSGQSNRVITHDGGRSEFVKATVRHEAAHQSAFNSGVHSRLCDTPKWISEGIGQMFEPQGMTSRRAGAPIAEKINRDSLKFLKRTYPQNKDPEFVRHFTQLMGDDTMFDHPKQVNNAYAIAWATMFYLAEREPQRFAALIERTSQRPPFREYPRRLRVDDVEKAFGCDRFEMSQRVSRYFHSL